MSSSASPPEGPSTPPAWGGPERLFTWLRGLGLRRDTSDRWVAGVCSGVAARLGVDPLVVRAATLVLLLFGGIGVALYALAWAFLPTQDGEIRAEQALRGDVGSVVLLVVVALIVAAEVTDRPSWVLVPIGVSLWIAHHMWRGTCGKSSAAPPLSAAEQPSAGSSQVAPPVGPAGSAATAATPPEGMPPGTPHGMGPGRTWAASTPPPSVPTASPTPPSVRLRQRRPGIGLLGVLVVVGSAVLAYGVAAASGATARPVAFGLVCAVATLGLGLLVVGLLGRRAPGLATLGIAAAVAAAVAVAVPSVSWSTLRGGGMGEVTWRSPVEGSDSVLQWGAGEATLDLSAFPAPAPGSAPVSASLGLGELVIVVPAGRTVEVDATVGAGEIIRRAGVRKGDTTVLRTGSDLHERVLVGTGPPDIRVTANVGLGEIAVVTP